MKLIGLEAPNEAKAQNVFSESFLDFSFIYLCIYFYFPSGLISRLMTWLRFMTWL